MKAFQNRQAKPGRWLSALSGVAALGCAIAGCADSIGETRTARLKKPRDSELIRVEGTARNAEGRATVVDRHNRIVACRDRPRWGNEIVGRHVMIEGVYERTQNSAPTPSGSHEVVPTVALKLRGLRECRGWLRYPGIATQGSLRIWLKRHAQNRGRTRLRTRMPIEVTFGDSARTGIKHASVWQGSGEPDRTTFEIDDTALGVSMPMQLRGTCPSAASGCVVWVEGDWGPLYLFEADPEDAMKHDIFSVLTSPVALTPKERIEAGVFVKISSP